MSGLRATAVTRFELRQIDEPFEPIEIARSFAEVETALVHS